MSDQYSPERRTALVLTGTGADGAYQAGVLRALHEAGVKIDLVCGRGIGAVSAMLVAVDGASRLWDQKGLWRARSVAHLYRWRWPIRVLFGLLAALAGVLASPLIFLALAVVAYPLGLLFGMAGLDRGAEVAGRYIELLGGAFAPGALPTWLPRLITVIVIAALLTLVVGSVLTWRRTPFRRRSRGPLAWAVLGAPLEGTPAAEHFTTGLWDLLRGGTALKTPQAEDLSRRFSELLNENLGQPGFSELLLAVHDLDARSDLVFGLVREPYRRTLFPAQGATSARRAEAFDLAGLARDHLVDVIRAAVSVPGLTEPALARFAPDSYWRGEVHRLIDRPASLSRLLEEAAAAGAEQLILVAASPEPPGPHELARPRLDPLGRISEHASSMESAAVRDAVRHVQHRFRAVYQIRPSYNPVGAFDLDGAYDERSDRRHPLSELMERGYEDAYRDFIEPVVAASGENLRSAAQEGS
jgi:predicted acylesterase/phospholipase RssA